MRLTSPITQGLVVVSNWEAPHLTKRSANQLAVWGIQLKEHLKILALSTTWSNLLHTSKGLFIWHPRNDNSRISLHYEAGQVQRSSQKQSSPKAWISALIVNPEWQV